MDGAPKKLRVAFPRQFPAASTECGHFPHLLTSSDCLMVEIVKLIATELKAEIEVYPIDTGDHEFSTGIVTSQKATGLMGLVWNQTVETLAYPLQSTELRKKLFNFSFPLYNVETNILHRRHDTRLSSLYSFFTIYDMTSWTFMALILGVQVLFFIAHEYAKDAYELMDFNRVTNGLWNAMQLSLGQPLRLQKRDYALRLNLIVMQFLHFIVLLGVYSSWVLSEKLALNEPVAIEGMSDLVHALEQKERRFVSTTGRDWFYETVNHSNTHPYNRIREAMKKNPLVVTRSKMKTLELVDRGNGLAVVNEDDESMFMMKRSFCNILPISEPAAVKSAHLIFKNGNPWIERVNAAIRNNSVAIVRIYRKYMHYKDRLHPPDCPHRSTRINNHVTLPYYGLCLVWAILIGVSTVVFFLEFFLARVCFRS
ncbi:hypothetical protein M3Y99_00727800 [Aphelenchoides fujianensis]|nr:hypothetical protein M3Y99_00727800 [Aphelenchoides fujianensis]